MPLTDNVLGNAQAVFVTGNEHIDFEDILKSKPHPPPFLVRHTLSILPILVVLSSVALLFSYVVPKVRSFIVQRRRQPIFLDDDGPIQEEVAAPEPYMPSQGLWADFTAHIRRLRINGTTIVLLDVFRLLCLSALLGLSIYATILAESPEEEKGGGRKKNSDGFVEDLMKKKKKKKNKTVIDEYSTLEWGEFGACIFYLYNLLFCFLILTLRHARLRRRLTGHVDLLLLVAFSLFAYRDIWPKLTYYLVPTDLDNWVTWSRVGILGVAAVVIPLIRPRTYIPVNPLSPTPEADVHPEQTTAPLFLVFYEFMTPLVLKAWGTTALPYDDLHPLADYDRAEYLYDKHIGILDPMKRRERGSKPLHLFWGLIYNFRWQFFWCSVLCAGAAVGEMLPAVAINNVLGYLQADGVGAKIRPLVWVSLLFFGPLLSTLSINFYIFIMTRCLVRTEAVLTQLLFDHALRLRMKDSIGDEDEKKPGVETPLIQVESDEGSSSESQTATGSANGNGTGVKDPEAPTAAATKSQGLVGKINVLMASDIESIGEGRDLCLVFIYIPIQTALCLYMLFKILSWSAMFGVAAMILTLPIPGLITSLSAGVQNERMESTDARVDSITEAVSALRIIKMFGWEEKIKARIATKREVELGLTWKRRVLNLLIEIVNIFLPVVVMAASFAGYTLVQKKQLTAATVFTSMTVFEILKNQMMMGFWMIGQFVTSFVSLQRVNKFMQESDLIDAYSVSNVGKVTTPEELEAQEHGLIRLRDATFAWGIDSTNKNIMNFRLRVPDVTFAKGKINLICGPTGSGKSSFLAALIGELHFEPRDDESFFYLPRDGGVSYAAQESWCMSSSIKDNILFGAPLDEARYLQVLHDCALETDLKLFDDGDETEIGEKGITLSGGQKARITLARAIYSDAKVVLLDDIFSALDTLTSRFILDNLFKGSLVKDRTVLLVTHHTHLAGPIADYMVTLREDGTVGHAGPIEASMISTHPSETDLESVTIEDKLEQKEANGDLTKAVNAKIDEEAQKKPSKLVKDEEKSEGRISRKALFSFFNTFGGPIFWIIYFGLLLAGQAITAFQTWWLGRWAAAYESAAQPSDVSVPYWLGLYMAWVVIGIGSMAISAIVYYRGAMRASRVIHALLVDKIFGAYMRFLDTTPVGRIISRFTKDMKAIDGPFTDVAIGVFEITLALIIKFFTIVLFVPIFSIPAIAIGAIGAFIGELYIHSQLSVKREMSNAKSPLFSHLAASVSGIVSIRAYGAQAQIKAQTRAKADKYTRAATAFYNLNRWVTVRIDMLGGLFAMSLAAFLVYGKRLDPSTVGFALSQGISFAGMILWWVRMINEMEVSGNSVERIEDYLVIDQEPASEKDKTPPASWPTSGEIVLENLSAKYSADGPTVLDDLTLHIRSGEKVGIVGRTGSGKSTLALALLRMVPTTGSVTIDGQRTDKMNLHDLRTNVTIIPQDPILLSGSLRFNLDPFGEHDDAELNDAMQRSGLGQVQRSTSGSSTPLRITLDTQIAAGGSNLSQGQRQLVALARALVRQSKVLILDEATASVDFDTDTLIQKSIRDLPQSTTVLTVAHRLATVMDYDKILVLGHGKVLEFDTPDKLRADGESYFAKLVQAMEG